METTLPVTLQEITNDNLRQILKLDVAAAQQHFVASNAVSLAQAHFEPYAWYRAIYAADTPVGFVMLYDQPYRAAYYLWRLMVDARYQGRGYGHQAVQQVIDYVRTRPGATQLRVSYIPGPGSPQSFYHKLGFAETGEVEDGETVMALHLTYPPGQEPAPALGKPLTHVVLFRLQDPSEAVINETIRQLSSLPGRVPTLRHLEVGHNIVPSDRAYDLALITRFDDLAGMEAYQAHPAHQQVLAYMRTVIASAAAADYESQP
ncbi:MAG: GNAT family N-acetyltransferase [Anaerolineales bacterium]|nr:GNAT family N-acetyltransferase [Anaerolineales bacterium]